MATSAQAVRNAPAPGLEEANFFELALGSSEITFTAHNKAGEPLVSYNDGITPRNFKGDEIRLEPTEIGTLVTVTLETTPDLETNLLTLVLPQVQVSGSPENVSVPVVFTRIAMSIAGPPLTPGPVQTYGVKIYSGTASFIVS
jgi:hypothetical protein